MDSRLVSIPSLLVIDTRQLAERWLRSGDLPTLLGAPWCYGVAWVRVRIDRTPRVRSVRVGVVILLLLSVLLHIYPFIFTVVIAGGGR